MKVIFFTICIQVLASMSVGAKTKLDLETRMELAKAHYERVLWKVKCDIPQPRVVQIESTHLRLIPGATILHRCGNSAGCCDYATERCVAKKKEKVELFFIVLPNPFRSEKRSGRNKVKKLVFTNHTECHCLDISDIPR